MENYYDDILKDTNYISELGSITIEDDNIFFAVLTNYGNDEVLLFNCKSLIVLDDLNGNVLSTSNIDSKLAKNFIKDIATLIVKDFGSTINIEENIEILSVDKERIKLLFRDERLESEFIILFDNKNISIFDSETEKKIATSEYNLDMVRIVMMNIFSSNFCPDVPHIFYDYFGEEENNANNIDLATPILSAVNYNLIMNDFTTYFNRLEGLVTRDNIKSLIRPFVRSGWTGAVKFILENTNDNVVRSNNHNIIFRDSDDIAYEVVSDMIQSNNQEMFDFIFDEFMPRYGYDDEINYTDLAFMIIDFGTIEQFEYLSCKLPIEIDLARQEDNLFGATLLFDAIIEGKSDIAEYLIFEYDIDPNEESFGESYIATSVKTNIEIFKLLISKDGLVLSEEDEELIESKARSNEKIMIAYAEYLAKNGFEIAIANFNQNEEQLTVM